MRNGPRDIPKTIPLKYKVDKKYQKFAETISVAGGHLLMAFIMGMFFGVILSIAVSRGELWRSESHLQQFLDLIDLINQQADPQVSVHGALPIPQCKQ
jgi:hypothetical protein